jgi:hypothetical protein
MDYSVSSPVVQFQWLLPVSEYESHKHACADAGAQELRRGELSAGDQTAELAEAAFEPVTILLGAVVTAKLAQLVHDFVQDARRSGIVVDATGPEVTVKPDMALRGGQCVLRDAHGVRIVDMSDRDGLVSLAGALAGR